MTEFFDPLDWRDYDVTCARCGLVLPASQAYVEEGDEWECEDCWEVQESKQIIGTVGLDLEL